MTQLQQSVPINESQTIVEQKGRKKDVGSIMEQKMGKDSLEHPCKTRNTKFYIL